MGETLAVGLSRGLSPDIPGGNMNRPALKELLEDIRKGLIDVVVVYKIDRLSRSLCDFTDLSRIFEKHNVSFVSVTQQIDTSSPAGRMLLNILMTFAQFEREMTADRIRDKVLATRKKGLWTGGIVPFGYKLDSKRLVPDPENLEALNFIFKRYSETGSPKTVVAEFTRRYGVNCGGRKWTTATINRLVRSCTYIGMVPHGPSGQMFKGVHEPIVDEELWKCCQRVRDETIRGKNMAHDYSAPLKGLLRCGHCGCALTPAFSNKRGGRRYVYYRCVADSKSGESDCPIKSVSGEVIERIVCGQLGFAMNTPEFLRLAAGESDTSEDDVKRAIADIPGLVDNMPPAERDRLLHCLIDEVIVDEKGVDIIFRREIVKEIGKNDDRQAS